MESKTIENVKTFWEANPLFSGEPDSEPGTKACFDQRRGVSIDDCFTGEIDSRVFPAKAGAVAVSVLRLAVHKVG